MFSVLYSSKLFTSGRLLWRMNSPLALSWVLSVSTVVHIPYHRVQTIDLNSWLPCSSLSISAHLCRTLVLSRTAVFYQHVIEQPQTTWGMIVSSFPVTRVAQSQAIVSFSRWYQTTTIWKIKTRKIDLFPNVGLPHRESAMKPSSWI